MKWNFAWYVSMEFKLMNFFGMIMNKIICMLRKRYLDRTSVTIRLVGTGKHLRISDSSHTHERPAT